MRAEVNERKAYEWKEEYEECQKTLNQKQRLLEHFGDSLKQIFHPDTVIEVTLPPPVREKTRRSVPITETSISNPNYDEVEGEASRLILKLSFARDVNQELEDDPEGVPIPTSRPFKRSRTLILSETEEEGGLPSAYLNAAQSSTEESDELNLRSAKKTKPQPKRFMRARPTRRKGAKKGPEN
ncbi:hypothetical protein Clacol_010103 [Clathrus columnatus]|uniref:Uncharacterized protein n=1 Tax=Clathrus columnatus TaxID=1419009 RepID=A0AAV5AN11_9AGAM|nr:hypothetical protein Clacol_010103 [Clathrus columnatus]